MIESKPSFILLELTLVGCAIFVGISVELTWPGFIGLGLISLAAISPLVTPAKRLGNWLFAWPGTLLLVPALLVRSNIEDVYQFRALLGAELALIAFITANAPAAGNGKRWWTIFGFIWGVPAAGVLVGISYLNNSSLQFHFYLAAGVVLLILCRLLFRPGPIGIQVVNTLILLLVALPVVDFVIRWRAGRDMFVNPAKYYSYEAATKNPRAFGAWTRYYGQQWLQLSRQIMIYDTNGFTLFRFRPGTQAPFFQSVVSINQKGFRGPEIPDKKGNAYRIIALGESTTFGCPLTSLDRPWPELLEEMIRERLHPARPIQVINAGVPGSTLPGNVRRLTNELFALKPDMIISYHGFNGFNLLRKGLPPIAAVPPPFYQDRPLMLLADLEYGLKLNHYKRALKLNPSGGRASPIPPMKSEYADAYRTLIDAAHSRHIQLVLANYSMAVNTNSDTALIDFYGRTTMDIRDNLLANVAHSQIVQQLSKEHPEICFVDTQPQLDGRHEYFIDLMHFAGAGDRKMAEIFFAGIRKTLESRFDTQN